MSFPSDRRAGWLKRLGCSFVWAARGFWNCLRRERNFRIHLCAAAAVLALGAALEVSRAEWAVLFLSCGGVLAAELQNSALEAAADLIAPGYHPLAGLAKDMAAAGVLCAAVFAAAAGLAILWRPEELRGLAAELAGSPERLLLVLGLLLAALAFIFFPGDKGEPCSRPGQHHDKGKEP